MNEPQMATLKEIKKALQGCLSINLVIRTVEKELIFDADFLKQALLEAKL